MDLWKMGLWKLFLSGGPVMWPILLASIFAFAVIIEKFWHLHSIQIDIQGFVNNLMDKIKGRNIKEALRICEATKGPFPRMIKAAIQRYDKPRAQIIEAIEDVSMYEIPRLEKNMPMLATIGHIAPLLGLLGTVTGMVRCFQMVQVKASSLHPVSAGDLAGGIWEALLTTVAGLVVAIPTYVAYNYLVNRINHLVLEMEKASTEFVNFLTE